METITAREARDVGILAASEALTVTWSRYGPGERGPDPHIHREHTDAFYVLEGALVFVVGPALERIEAPAGTYVSVPPGVVHSFWNAGEVDAKFINHHAPDGGFAAFMRGARDGVSVLWDSYPAPADGGVPADGVVVAAAGHG